MKRRALVTGATGFVGGHLAEHLDTEGWSVRALVRQTSDCSRLQRLGTELCMGDLRDGGAVREAMANIDTVFHLAAVTGLRSDKDFEGANVAGTRSIVEAVRVADPRPRRVVYLSSYAACGPSDGDRPRSRDETPAPLTAYGRTKLAGEEIVRQLEGDGVEAIVLRAPTVYGPGDHALLPYFRLVQKGLAPAPVGAARWLHVIYVGDLARALVRAADVPAGTYPVAEPREYTWDEIATGIADTLGRRPLRVPVPAGMVRVVARCAEAVGSLRGTATILNREKAEELLARSWTCDLSGSEALLSREEATPLSEGISRTVRWYKRQGWL